MNEDQLQDAKLRELAKRLGAAAAERLDVEATAQAVVERLRAEPRARRWTWMQPAWLRIAAAVAFLLVGGGLLTRTLMRGPGTAGSVLLPVGADLGDLSVDQLREILSILAQPLDSSRAVTPEAGLEDLSAPELRALLRSLEG